MTPYAHMLFLGKYVDLLTTCGSFSRESGPVHGDRSSFSRKTLIETLTGHVKAAPAVLFSCFKAKAIKMHSFLDPKCDSKIEKNDQKIFLTTSI